MAKYVEILFRRWLHFVILLLLLPAAITAASVAFMKTHEASATLWVQDPTYFGSNSASVVGWNSFASPAQNQADNFGQMTQTRSFAERLGDRLTESQSVLTPIERDRIVGSIDRKLNVTATGSHLVNITYSCERPVVCLKVISSAIDLFHERLAEIQKGQAQVASTFFESQLRRAEEDLKRSQDTVKKYLLAHPGVALTDRNANPELDLLLLQMDQNRKRVDDMQRGLVGIQVTGDEASRLFQSISTVVDPPRMTRDGFIGVKGTLKRGLLIWLGCLAAAAAYLFLLTWLDRTARDPQELERRLRVPVLVTIPHFAEIWKF